MAKLGGQNLVIDYLVHTRSRTTSVQWRSQPPCASAQQRRFSGEPYRHRRCKTLEGHPSKPGNTFCTALKPPCSASQSRSTYRNATGLSRVITANMADVHRFVFTVETTCGGRWHASNLLFRGWQKVSDHSQRRDVERRFP